MFTLLSVLISCLMAFLISSQTVDIQLGTEVFGQEHILLFLFYSGSHNTGSDIRQPGWNLGTDLHR